MIEKKRDTTVTDYQNKIHTIRPTKQDLMGTKTLNPKFENLEMRSSGKMKNTTTKDKVERQEG